MSLTAAKAMTYEESTPNIKVNGKTVVLKQMERLNSPTIVWFLVKRHKVGLLVTSNIIFIALYMFPPLPDLLVSLI